MTRQLKEQREKIQEEKDKSLISAVEFELEGAIGHAGGELTGLSVRFGVTDCLMTLRVVLAGRQQVSFVGAPTLSDCFRKAVVAAYHDELRFKADSYAIDED